jgi:hypothetical protein
MFKSRLQYGRRKIPKTTDYRPIEIGRQERPLKRTLDEYKSRDISVGTALGYGLDD